jgi:hypothetical protein
MVGAVVVQQILHPIVVEPSARDSIAVGDAQVGILAGRERDTDLAILASRIGVRSIFGADQFAGVEQDKR